MRCMWLICICPTCSTEETFTKCTSRKLFKVLWENCMLPHPFPILLPDVFTFTLSLWLMTFSVFVCDRIWEWCFVAADLCGFSTGYYTITKTPSSCRMQTVKFGPTSTQTHTCVCKRTHHRHTSNACHAAHCPWSLFPEVRLYYSANIAAKLQLWHFSNRWLVDHWVFYQFPVSIKCILTTAQFNSQP